MCVYMYANVRVRKASGGEIVSATFTTGRGRESGMG